MARKMTSHPPSYAEAKKMMLLTLHTHGCPRGYLKGLLFFSLNFCMASCTSQRNEKQRHSKTNLININTDNINEDEQRKTVNLEVTEDN